MSIVWLFVFVIFDCIWHIYGTIYIYMVYMAHIWYGIHTWYGIYGMALSSVLMSILYVYVFSCVWLCFVMFGRIWLCLAIFNISTKSQLDFKRLQLPTQWANNRNLAFFTSSWQVVMVMIMMMVMIFTIIILAGSNDDDGFHC